MTTISASTSSRSRAAAPERRGIRWGKVLGWATLIVLLLLTLFPFYWMLRTAFSTNSMLASHSDSLLPAGFTLDGFRRVFGLVTLEDSLAQGGAGGRINFWLYLRNSVIVATTITAGQVFFSAMAAYAFARLRWPGRDVVFTVFLSALMVPGIFTAIPNFVLIKELGLLNTFPGLVLPTLLMTPFAIFFLRQFLLGIPFEIEEAAALDGASRARTFLRIIIPMCSAPILTLAVLTYIQGRGTSTSGPCWSASRTTSACSRSRSASSGRRPRRAAPTGPASWPRPSSRRCPS